MQEKTVSMSYENGLQMHFVQIGLEEGIRRGESQTLVKIAKRMKTLGISVHAIATCLNLEENQVLSFLHKEDDFLKFETLENSSN